MTDFFYDSCALILKFLIPGIFLGIVYDIFRLFRIARNDKTYAPIPILQNRFFPDLIFEKTTKKSFFSDTVLIFAEDILFFFLVAVTEVLTLFHLNGGEIRIYGLLFSAVGFFVYQKTVGNLLIFLSKKILYLFRRILYWIGYGVISPIFCLIKMIKRIASFFKNKQRKKTKIKDTVS